MDNIKNKYKKFNLNDLIEKIYILMNYKYEIKKLSLKIINFV